MSDYITSDHVATIDEMRKAYMGNGSDAAPKHLVFNRWLESVEAAAEQRGAEKERERIARMVRAEVDGWDRTGGSYARQKHTMFNRLADRIAREGA